MAKVRVHELAKELGVSSKDVLGKLGDLGEYVKSASSTVEAPVVRKLKEAFTSAPAAKGGSAKRSARPTPAPAEPKASAPTSAPADAPAAPAPEISVAAAEAATPQAASAAPAASATEAPSAAPVSAS
ncbi:MAG TPA: translation initiation factor IF-2 N-terminal domain-containing protein, partial [Jiangellaceae bacterium]